MSRILVGQLWQESHDFNPVLTEASDFAVERGEQMLKTNAQAVSTLGGILRTLSGREHQVLTAVALALRDRVETQISVSSVWFQELGDAEIRRYVATGEPLDKAGAYAIQGRAGAFVTRIAGSYSGIMGLPLAETAELLNRFDIPLW